MSKYLKFKEIAFKGKTKRFEVVSKTSFDQCPECMGDRRWLYHNYSSGSYNCKVCNNERKIPIVLGRIQWYSQWRQYVFMPGYPTIWNRECMTDINFFITDLMYDRKIILTENKNE